MCALWWRAPAAPLALLAVPRGWGGAAPTPGPPPRGAVRGGVLRRRRPPPISMVDSAPPFVSRARRAGDGGVWCVLAHEAAGSMVDSAPPFVSRERRAGDGGVWCVLAHEAAGRTARWWRAPAAAVRFALSPPRGEGLRAPTPGPPTRGKLSLQAFARCARVLRFAQGVSVLAHGATRRVRAGGALPPRLFASLSAPEGRGYAPLPPDPYPRQARPYPRTPTRGKLSLQAFARCARVLRFAQGVLCSRTERPTRVRAVVARSRRAARSARGPRGEGLRAPTPGPPPAAS